MAFFQLGAINAGSFQDFDLTVCPVQKRGLITITDLELTEVFSKKIYKFEDFLQVFVVDKQQTTDVDQNVKYVVSAA